MCTTITLADAKAVVMSRLLPHSFKKPIITDSNSLRIITSTIVRLKIHHCKDMKIHPDETRSYIQCKCPEINHSYQNISSSAQIDIPAKRIKNPRKEM
ncbi:hypothetical protein TNIN_386631 [Trichonephila inaurata madagascariensis]|uniref:Uncharacterized protein n=1 Tax=Trichonephila inaurata madagascariensis TaxID=2747483 RepID=A0A8X6X3M7_9ARAC|nr:hypothetical protein TNIN_386631 [Trichonephila inaurata madagascariensis]